MGAQNNIDKIIFKNIGSKGFFIEAGGSDPTDQNNTFFLEKNGWSGIIIEPKKDFNDLYKNIRPNSVVENYVLVSFDYKNETILGDFSHYMMGGVQNTHKFPNWNPSEYSCATLSKILDKHNISEVDFFSLDVEGYEIEVLKGINFYDVFFHVLVIENHDQKGYKDDFGFLTEFGFEKRFIIDQHEFYINKKSKFFEKFSL